MWGASAVFALLAVTGVWGDTLTDYGEVTTLDRNSFDGFIGSTRKSQRATLVMFHVSWCKVCVRTLPKFVSASKEIQARGIPTELAHVDCTDDKTLCQRFDVRGYPTIKMFPVDEDSQPLAYKNARSEQSFVNYARRMTEPPVQMISDRDGLEAALSGEFFSALVVEAASVESIPDSVSALVETYRDRHKFLAAESLASILPAAGGQGGRLAIVSMGKQQWKGAKAKADPAINYFEGDIRDKDAVLLWWKSKRFPGIWYLDDSTFFEFTHSNSDVFVVAMDTGKVTGDEEKALRNLQRSFGSDFFFGVVNGVDWSSELADFNILTTDLPRVLVAEADFAGWYEDKHALDLYTAAQHLPDITAGKSWLLRQEHGLLGKVFFYKREGWRQMLRLHDFSQQGTKEFALASAMVLGVLAVVIASLICLGSCCKVMLADDFDEEEYAAMRARAARAAAARPKRD